MGIVVSWQLQKFRSTIVAGFGLLGFSALLAGVLRRSFQCGTGQNRKPLHLSRLPWVVQRRLLAFVHEESELDTDSDAVPIPSDADTVDPDPPYADPQIALHPISDHLTVELSSTDNIPLGGEARDLHMAQDGDPHRVIWQRRSVPGANGPVGLFRDGRVEQAEDAFFAFMVRRYGSPLTFWWRCSKDIRENGNEVYQASVYVLAGIIDIECHGTRDSLIPQLNQLAFEMCISEYQSTREAAMVQALQHHGWRDRAGLGQAFDLRNNHRV